MEVAAPAEGPSFSGSSDDNGGGFFLGGTAQLAQDPENPANDVIRINTTLAPGQCSPLTLPPFQNCPSGTVSRTVNVKVDKLDNMLEFKAWFNGYDVAGLKTCIGGSPRIQLAIDTDGDGESNGNAHGYFGASPNFAGCPSDTWLYEDLTGPGDFFITGGVLAPSTGYLTPNEELEWDLTQFGGSFYNTWSQTELFFANGFPQHLVCTVALVDDTFGAPGMSGIAYYDLFSAGKATWTDRSDIAGRGFAKGCGRPDHDDDDHDDDHDGDHDHDDDDDKYDDDRRERWGDDD
jgi:hypothetical protein